MQALPKAPPEVEGDVSALGGAGAVLLEHRKQEQRLQERPGSRSSRLHAHGCSGGHALQMR